MSIESCALFKSMFMKMMTMMLIIIIIIAIVIFICKCLLVCDKSFYVDETSGGRKERICL